MNVANTRISLVSNASAVDSVRLRLTVPHWLRVFDQWLGELVVLVDPTPPSGRIAALHGAGGSLAEVETTLRELASADSRLRWRMLPSGSAMDALLAGWFGRARPMRCQGGTPIAAFVAAYEAASEPILLRLDCDMLFHEAGWVEEAISSLKTGAAHIVEPARCGTYLRSGERVAISTRCAMVDMPRFRNEVLPITARRVDFLRRIHRRLGGRPPWLALEQMLDLEREAGRLRYRMLPEALGCSLHVTRRDEAALPIMPRVVAGMEAGEIPDAQRKAGMDFSEAAWQ